MEAKGCAQSCELLHLRFLDIGSAGVDLVRFELELLAAELELVGSELGLV